MIVMAILSLQDYGPLARLTFPMNGFSFDWWQSIFDSSLPQSNADVISSTGQRSLWLSLAAGAVVALLALTLSMAFRRRFRADGVLFYIVMLALMTPGFLLGACRSAFSSCSPSGTATTATSRRRRATSAPIRRRRSAR
jgi:putative spermidine/putrescine transport system permease protein